MSTNEIDKVIEKICVFVKFYILTKLSEIENMLEIFEWRSSLSHELLISCKHAVVMER